MDQLNEMTSDELRRRCNELARQFRERHPAKSRRSDFMQWACIEGGAGVRSRR